MSDRAVSTVLDVATCLLLVSAATLTLAGAPSTAADPARGTATETAAVLGSATATVEFSPPADDATRSRTRAGTYAELVAGAALANRTADGAALVPARRPHLAAVREAVRPLLSGDGWRGTVVATWRPHPGSHLVGRFRVGPLAPPGADVHVATVSVRAGPAALRDDALAAAPDGFDGIGRAVADGLVAWSFPADGRSLTGVRAGDRRLRDRYGAAAHAYGVAGPDEGRVGPANDRLRTTVARRVAADLRARYDSPVAAADAVAGGRVTVVVRTWST